MTGLSTRRFEIISLAVYAVLLIGLGFLFIDRHLDVSFNTYRYVANAIAGHGLVYNVGEHRLIPGVSPVYSTFLVVASLIESNTPLLSNLLGVVSIGVGGLLMFSLLYPVGRYEALEGALIYLTFPLLWMNLGLDIPLWLALGLGAVWSHQVDRDFLAGIMLGLGILLHAELLILALLIIAHGVSRDKVFNFTLPAWVLVSLVLGGFWGLIAYEDALVLFSANNPYAGLPPLASHVLIGFADLAFGLWSLSWFWVVIIPFMLIGFIPAIKQHGLLLVALWGISHLVYHGVLFIPVHGGTYLPFLIGGIGLAVLGVHWIMDRFEETQPQILIGSLSALLIGSAGVVSLVTILTTTPEVDPLWRTLAPAPVQPVHEQAGNWLRENTPDGATVAVTRLGWMGYTADRRLLDFQGQLADDLRSAFRRQDGGWWIAQYAPDVIILSHSDLEGLFGYAPTSDPWFNHTYTQTAEFTSERETETLLVFQRTDTPLALHDHIVGFVEFPGGIAINLIATDFSLSPLDEDREGRIRLEWYLRDPVKETFDVAIQIQGRGERELYAGLSNQTIDFSNWPAGELITTYHSIELLPALSPGVYDVEVGLGPNPFEHEWVAITIGKVPFPDADVLGGISGLRADFGTIVITGYRLARTSEGLEVFLQFQATGPTPFDYMIQLTLRDLSGATAVTFSGEPYDGQYPTSIWSTGEKISDTYLMDLDGVSPGEYEVLVSLVDEDGASLTTSEGSTEVFVGRVAIIEDTP